MSESTCFTRYHLTKFRLIKGLSTAAKAGIAVGAVVVVVALSVGLLFCLKRRNRVGRKTDTFDAGPSESELSGRVNAEDEQQKGLIPQTRPIRYPDPDDTNELPGGRTHTGH
jgi:hypothetical protein